MCAGAEAPFPDAAPSPGQHLKNVFYRMGLGNMEIVALSGAHTLGRAYAHRSGMGKESTIHTKDGPGTPGELIVVPGGRVLLNLGGGASCCQKGIAGCAW